MSRHALLLLANVDTDTHATKNRPTSPAAIPPAVVLVPATRRRLWGRNILDTALALGLL